MGSLATWLNDGSWIEPMGIVSVAIASSAQMDEQDECCTAGPHWIAAIEALQWKPQARKCIP